MEIKYFDIHSHLNLKPLRDNNDEVIFRMRENGTGTITVGVDFETSKDAIKIAEEYPEFYATVGLHPTDNTQESFDEVAYRELAEHSKIAAIGECGLDYYRLSGINNDKTKARQKEIFQKQIELAIAIQKPLMIHARPSKGTMDAYHEVLDMLENRNIRANFHFFVGDVEVAKRALALGFTMSFDGPITFSSEYDEVIRFLPIESIMAETDAPFAAPEPYRGKTCEPWMVQEIYRKIAEIKGVDEEKVRVALLENTRSFFNISF